ncbi:MAG: hypothetical protein ACF8LK_10415 [Phycisphaerales bacterium JB041]
MTEGIGADNRDRLERLHRAFEGPFNARDAALVLDLEPDRARRLLAYLASRGWLSRVKRGLYTTVPLGASAPSDWREDPWVVAVSVFAPCYIGGWTACAHWGLTEQVFRDVVVITARSIRSTRQTVQGTPFRLKQRAEGLHFGTRTVWRDSQRVQVSDPSRTVAEILDDPSLGGGIRHVADVVADYLDEEHRDTETLLSYLDRQGNRAAFKRLGYILETGGRDPDLVDTCRAKISAGLSALDPAVKRKGTISKRWNLRINVRLDATREPA